MEAGAGEGAEVYVVSGQEGGGSWRMGMDLWLCGDGKMGWGL